MIRKIILLLLILLAAIGLVLILQNPRVLDPMRRSATAASRQAVELTKIKGRILGDVVRVVDGTTVYVREASGVVYALRMAALAVPGAGAVGGAAGTVSAEQSRRALERLALHQPVQVDFIHLSTNRTGLGIIYAGTNNLNLSMVAAGMAATDLRHLDYIPSDIQLELLKAEKQARDLRSGLWAKP